MLKKILGFIVGFFVVCFFLYYMGWLGKATQKVQDTFDDHKLPKSTVQRKPFWESDFTIQENITGKPNGDTITVTEWGKQRMAKLFNNLIDYGLFFFTVSIIWWFIKDTKLGDMVKKLKINFNNNDEKNRQLL